MKNILLTIILISSFLSGQAQEQLQSMVEQWYRNGAWVIDNGRNYDYDQNGNIKSVVALNWNGTAWENFWGSHFEFNANNTIAQITIQDWSVNVFVNDERFLFEYGPDGGQIEELIYQFWNGIQWVVGSRQVFEYNQSGRITELRTEEWDGQWNNRERRTLDYSNGTVLLIEEWDGIQWLVYEKREYAYNIDGRVISETFYDWVSGQWEEYRRYESQYDATGNLLQEDEYSSGELSGRDECQYDRSKRLSDIDHFFWELFFEVVFQGPINFPYINKILSRTTLDYNENDESFEPVRREVYNYEQKIMTSSQDVIGRPNYTAIYPNPVSSLLNVKGGELSGTPYVILNMAGKTVQQGNIELHNSLRVDDLPSGTYILMIEGKHNFNFIKN
jgi:hypothetical protein